MFGLWHSTNRWPTPVMVRVVIAAGLLSGCSESLVPSDAMAGGAEPRAAVPAANSAAPAEDDRRRIRERFASGALDDHRLGELRGGFDTSSGLVVNFSFQEATYVNHNLAQSILIPTLTVSPGLGAAVPAGNFVASAVAPLVNSAVQTPTSAPAAIAQSLVNSGMTSVISSLGPGGITNLISNSANNQLVQQVITANIGITGLPQTIQQSLAATVMSRLGAANAPFR